MMLNQEEMAQQIFVRLAVAIAADRHKVVVTGPLLTLEELGALIRFADFSADAWAGNMDDDGE